jgi:Mce-associated membrane protein
LTEQIVASAAKQKSLKTTAHVMGAAVSELHPDSAVVLVFVDQSTTGKDKPNPSPAASDVLVSLTRGQQQLADHQVRPDLGNRVHRAAT